MNYDFACRPGSLFQCLLSLQNLVSPGPWLDSFRLWIPKLFAVIPVLASTRNHPWQKQKINDTSKAVNGPTGTLPTDMFKKMKSGIKFWPNSDCNHSAKFTVCQYPLYSDSCWHWLSKQYPQKEMYPSMLFKNKLFLIFFTKRPGWKKKIYPASLTWT